MGYNKKYFMRCPSEQEKKFMMDVFKKYQSSGDSSFTVTEWNFYDETPSHYGVSIRANGLIDWAGKPYPDNFGVNYLITKEKIRKFMKDNGIVKPSFNKATFIKHKT